MGSWGDREVFGELELAAATELIDDLVLLGDVALVDGYLILFAPLAFAPQRRSRSSELPSQLVFLRISTHFTATLGIPFTSTVS